MTREIVRVEVRCPKSEAGAIPSELVAHLGDCELLSVQEEVAASGGILAREPFRQIELVDLLVALAVNIASSAACDVLEARVAKFKRGRAQIRLLEDAAQTSATALPDGRTGADQ